MIAGRLKCPYCNRRLKQHKTADMKFLILCNNTKCDFIVRTKQQYSSHRNIYKLIKKYENKSR